MAKKNQHKKTVVNTPKNADKPQHFSPNEQPKTGFLHYLRSAENRVELIAVLAMQIVLFVFLKIRFPYPFTESDSGNYILSANTGKINGYRPYGYSAFIRFFHSFSDNIQFVITWQYLLTALSVFLLLFTVRYHFKLSRIPFLVLAVLLIFNPSILYLDTYIMSDGLFVALTALWLTSGIAIVFGGAWWLLIVNLLLMYWCIDTRYIGMFYPLFSAAVFVWRFWEKKAVAVGLAIVPFVVLWIYHSGQTKLMKEEFGTETFSAFGGWQKANNAVAVLPYVKVNEQEITDPQIKSIHQFVRSFPDSMFEFPAVSATSFMWLKNYPGKLFLQQFIRQNNVPYLQAWVYCGTLMDQYGSWLESNYRTEYFKHYILPNAKEIFTVWGIDEHEKFEADQNIKNYFQTDTDKYEYGKPFFDSFLPFRKIADVVLWLAFFISLAAGAVLFKKLSLSPAQKLAVIFPAGFLLAFLAVSVYAAPINNFRYLMPIYYVQVVVPFLIFAGRKKQ